MIPEVSDGTFEWLRRGVWLVLAVGVLALLVRGADGPPDPHLVPADADDAGTVEEAELSAGAAVVPEDDGEGALAPPTTATAPGEVPDPAVPVPTPSGPGPSGASPSPSTTIAPAPPPPVATMAPARRPLPGFGETDFRITAGGRTFDGVALLADDGPSRSQGLMEQTDLRGYDAMVFRFDSPTTGEFYMRNTRIPLSIAFFDAQGRFVSSADMEPCPDEVRRCPTYGAARPYLHAIEVPAGDLGRMGIGPGAVLSFP